MTDAELTSAASSVREQMVAAFDELAAGKPHLAVIIGQITAVVAGEASRNSRFAKALSEISAGDASEGAPGRHPTKKARRPPGPWDPFAVYAEEGIDALRERLKGLDLEELRNIVAEHGMDTDRLAMKWKAPDRVIARIVDRVVDRAAKGEGFRGPSRFEPEGRT